MLWIASHNWVRVCIHFAIVSHFSGENDLGEILISVYFKSSFQRKTKFPRMKKIIFILWKKIFEGFFAQKLKIWNSRTLNLVRIEFIQNQSLVIRSISTAIC